MRDVQTGSHESWEELLGLVRTRYGDGALHQFVVACCRRIWHLLADPRSQAAVEVAERYFAGRAEIEEVDAAREQAWDAESQALRSDEPDIGGGRKAAAARAAMYAVYTDPPEQAGGRLGYAADDAAWALEYAAEAAAHAKWLGDRAVDWDAEYEKEVQAQRSLFREQFGAIEGELPEQSTPADDPNTSS